MAVYAYSKVAVYTTLGGAVRPATLTRVLVTDTVTGDPVNVTQGTRTAPYLDTDTAGVASFTAEHPGPLRLTTGATFMDVYSNELPGIALDAVTAAESAETAALAAQAAAEDAASLVGAPADSAMALTAGNPASAFRGALDDVYATQAQITAALDTQDAAVSAALAAVEASAASIEDLCFTTHIQTGATTTWPNTSNVSVPLFSAPFPCEITRVAMLMWSSMGNAPLSDTSYWLVEIRRHSADNTVVTTLAQKSTKTTAVAAPGGPTSTGVPAGTAIAARIPWVFTSALLAGAELDTGESLSWNTFPTDSPTAMYGPVSITVSYRPL